MANKDNLAEKIYKSIGLSCLFHDVPIVVRIPLKKEINHTKYIEYRRNPKRMLEEDMIDEKTQRIINMFLTIIFFYIAFALFMV